MDITGKDLLQFDATVIAGILILLSITFTVAEQYGIFDNSNWDIMYTIMLFFSILPFLGSAFFLIQSQEHKEKNENDAANTTFSWGRSLAMYGLLYLGMMIAVIVVIVHFKA